MSLSRSEALLSFQKLSDRNKLNYEIAYSCSIIKAIAEERVEKSKNIKKVLIDFRDFCKKSGKNPIIAYDYTDKYLIKGGVSIHNGIHDFSPDSKPKKIPYFDQEIIKHYHLKIINKIDF